MNEMQDCFIMEASPCEQFLFEDSVEHFDPNVEYIVGPAGPQGPQGPQGPAGEYSSSNPPPYPVTSVDGKTGAVTVLPTGGTTGQVLKKRSNTSRDVEWGDETGGGGSVTAEDAGSVSPPSPFILAIGEGGTGADSAAGARENLDLDSVYAKELIALGDFGTSAKTITLVSTNYQPCLIVTNGTSAARQGLYIVALRRTSAPTVTPVVSASGVTINTAVGSLTLTGASTNTFGYLIPLSNALKESIQIT